MESKKSKRLIMVGIRRKGEKGFKTRIKEGVVPCPIDIKNLHLPITEQTEIEKESLIKQ